ncbi:MAG: BNR-4 repeat-containing protein [Candidatus Hydrogenedentes bacterium]|nr:BNR-4 repeat-containing protein [Candidatus Hydrogenedentota bacterium]
MPVAVLLSVTLALWAAGVSPASERLEVEPIWSGHPVGFSLLTHGDRQFVAYYDAERHMKVAARALDSTVWDFVELPEQLGWDSHNGTGCHVFARMGDAPTQSRQAARGRAAPAVHAPRCKEV